MKALPLSFIISILFVSAASLLSSPSDSVEFVHDNGTAAYRYTDLLVGDIEASRFTTEHPCSLYEISLYLGGSGTLELHIWEDWSIIPDVTKDIVAPIYVTPMGGEGWKVINLETQVGHKVYIPPKTDFHIGRVILGGGDPSLFITANHTSYRYSHIYFTDEGDWGPVMDGEGYLPYMIRAKGIYFDIDTVKQFKEVTDSTDLVLGGSIVAWGDYNNDGYDDIGSNSENHGRIYRNLSGSTFDYTNVELNGVISWGDFSGDGLLDAVTAWYANMVGMWRNNGDGTFLHTTEALGIEHISVFRTCAGFGDINGDGWLDLYVCGGEQWQDPPLSPIPYADRLYLSQAGTLFVEVTDSFAPTIKTDPRYSRAVSFCDFDTDGDIDIYVSCYRLDPNYFLVNDGTGHFTDMSVAYGVAGHPSSIPPETYYGHSIGSEWCDFDNDGDFDLICANLAHPRYISFSDKTYIFRNDGESFTDIFSNSGIRYYETHSCPATADYDNDGNLDIFFTTVYADYHSWMYKGNGDGTFTLDNYDSGVWTLNGWGAAWSDYDNDGDLDLLCTGNGLHLYRNDRCPFYNNWVELRLFCDDTTVNHNYFAYGAQARLYLPDGRILSRCIQGNTGTEGCMASRTMHFGLGDVTVADSLVILWPGLGSPPVSEKLVIPNLATDKWIYTIYKSGRIDTVTGIAERRIAMPDAPSIYAYPNPFNSSVTISLSCYSRESGNPGVGVMVEIFDINGRLVYSPSPSVPLPVGEGGQVLLPLGEGFRMRAFTWAPDESISSGVYLVRARVGDKSVTKRVVYLK